MNNSIIIVGILIFIALSVLIIVELTSPTRVKTVTKTEVLPIPYNRRHHRRRHDYPPYRPYIPGRIIGDRSNPFCEHTANGCYPGTTTPIP